MTDSSLEFPIWGIPPGAEAETLLHTQCRDRADADSVLERLERLHGCTACRVQVLDLGDADALADMWRA